MIWMKILEINRNLIFILNFWIEIEKKNPDPEWLSFFFIWKVFIIILILIPKI